MRSNFWRVRPAPARSRSLTRMIVSGCIVWRATDANASLERPFDNRSGWQAMSAVIPGRSSAIDPTLPNTLLMYRRPRLLLGCRLLLVVGPKFPHGRARPRLTINVTQQLQLARHHPLVRTPNLDGSVCT